MLGKKKAALGIIIAFTVFTVVALASLGHCATTATLKHKDSLGVVMQQTNLNSYIAGSVINVEFAGKPENYGMVVRVQPLKTYTLYTEELFLCGDPSDEFAGHRNPMVLVYETTAHHMVEGIGCHELKAVRDIIQEKLK